MFKPGLGSYIVAQMITLQDTSLQNLEGIQFDKWSSLSLGHNINCNININYDCPSVTQRICVKVIYM